MLLLRLFGTPLQVRRTAAAVTAHLLAHLAAAGEAGVGGIAMALVSVLARCALTLTLTHILTLTITLS